MFKPMTLEEQRQLSIEKKRKHLTAKKQRQREINSTKKFKAKLADERGCNVLRYVQTMTGLAPFNTRKGTEYLLPAGSVCLMERLTDGWFALYLDCGNTFDSIEDVRTCKKVKAKRHEFKYLNKKVTFSRKENIVLNQMLSTKYTDDLRQLQHRFRNNQTYSNGLIVNGQGQRLLGKALQAVN